MPTMTFEAHRGGDIVETTARDDNLRAFHLLNVMNGIKMVKSTKEKAKIVGENIIFEISEAPKAGNLTSTIKDTPADVIARADHFEELAERQLGKACGYCSLREICSMATDYSKFSEKYTEQDNRDLFAQSLAKDPKYPC